MGDELWSIPPTGQSGAQSSSNPFATVTTYTPANLPLTITKPGEASVTDTYDAALNQVSSANPAATTTTVYDGDNRPCYQLVGAAGSGSGLTCSSSPQAGSTSTAYVPGSDNVLTSTDGNGKSTSYYYSDLAHPNSPTEVVDVLGTQIQYTAYNDFGNACVAGDVAITAQGTTSQCNTVAGDTATVYNALGDETSETDPSGNTTSYAYTNTAYPTLETSTTNALGAVTAFSYDADGNPIKTTNPDSTTVSTAYDADGRVCTQSDTGTSYGCDTGTGIAGVANYVYDNASDRTGMTSTALSSVSNVSDIGDGGAGCAVTGTIKSVKCWGFSAGGALENTESSATPVAVGGLTGVTQVSTGGQDACAVLTGGTLECWGNNASGQLGNGTTTNSYTPVAVSGLTAVSQVSVGGEANTCAVLSSGHADCWGWNYYGQLGDDSENNSDTPAAVYGLTNATEVSVGTYSACAVLSTGHVDCWGGDAYGELGNSTYYPNTSYVPVPVGSVTGAVAVTVGSQFACALLSSGGVDCWGLNSEGQIGNSNGNSTYPWEVWPVTGLSNATQITANQAATCALLSTGAVNCWGYGSDGELGDGVVNGVTYTPVAVTGISTATQVSGSCALLAAGTLQCWGGDGTAVGDPAVSGNALSPVPVVNGASYTFANGQLIFAVDQNGEVVSYLYNYAGQVQCVAYPVVASSSCGTLAAPASPSTSNTIVTSGYDTSGRLTSTTDWLGNETTYAYGDANYPNDVTEISYPSSTGLTANYTYDPDGNLTDLVAGSSINDAWTYNADQQVATTKINASTSAAVGYNANSQITAAANLATSTSNDTYTIAANGEITSDAPPSGSATDYTYNVGDELCNAATSSVTCSSDPSTGTNFTYTTNGERSVAAPYTSGTAGAATYYAWNAYGELCNVASSATACGSTPTSGTSYQYNGDGLRLSAVTSTTTSDSTWDVVSGGSIPLNINDAATTSGTTTNTSYLYGSLLFGGTSPIEQISGLTATFLVANPTGVQGDFSLSGSVNELAVYSVYGKQTIASGSSVTPFGFQGSYTDSTGLIYLINRYYDPATDQFLSVDPEVAQTDQPYVFTNDDPLNDEDPLGTCWICSVFSSAARAVAKVVIVVTAATAVVTLDVADAFDPIDLAADIAIGATANGLVYFVSSGKHTSAGQREAVEEGGAFGAAAYFIPLVAAAASVSVTAANTIAGAGENVVQYLQHAKHPTISGITRAAAVGAAQGASIDKLVKILKK